MSTLFPALVLPVFPWRVGEGLAGCELIACNVRVPSAGPRAFTCTCRIATEQRIVIPVLYMS